MAQATRKNNAPQTPWLKDQIITFRISRATKEAVDEAIRWLTDDDTEKRMSVSFFIQEAIRARLNDLAKLRSKK